MSHRIATTFLALGCLCAAAVADEVKLKDGRVLVGTVVERGKILEITTRDGTVRVHAAEVLSRRTDGELRQALADLRAGTADTSFSRFQLARQAHAWGLEDEMWELLDGVVDRRRDGQESGLISRMNDFLAQLEPELLPRRYHDADTRKRVRELLFRVRNGVGAGKLAAIEELLVREPNADRDLRIEARGSTSPERRLVALEALIRRGTGGNDRFLYRTAILDGYAEIRGQAMLLAQRYCNTVDAVEYLAPGLMHPSAAVRIRTAEAYANLRDLAALKLLVAAGPAAGTNLQDAGPGVRGHIAILNQQAYIRDFDVEVAQASFIADPKVDVLQSGVVLDVTVHAVVTHRTQILRAYRGALQHLAGSDPGAKPENWAAWLAELTPQVTAPATGARDEKKG